MNVDVRNHGTLPLPCLLLSTFERNFPFPVNMSFIDIPLLNILMLCSSAFYGDYESCLNISEACGCFGAELVFFQVQHILRWKVPVNRWHSVLW